MIGTVPVYDSVIHYQRDLLFQICHLLHIHRLSDALVRVVGDPLEGDHAVSYTHLYNLEATNNIYLPGGRRVRGFVGIEPLVHPCP